MTPLTDIKLPTLGELRASVAEANEGAKSRLMGDDTIVAWRAAARRCIAYAKRHNLNLREVLVYADGGAVSKSYRYGAETTAIRLSDGVVQVSRTRARTVPHGDAGIVTARARDPGHKSTGRCRKHAGWAYPLQPR